MLGMRTGLASSDMADSARSSIIAQGGGIPVAVNRCLGVQHQWMNTPFVRCPLKYFSGGRIDERTCAINTLRFKAPVCVAVSRPERPQLRNIFVGMKYSVRSE